MAGILDGMPFTGTGVVEMLGKRRGRTQAWVGREGGRQGQVKRLRGGKMRRKEQAEVLRTLTPRWLDFSFRGSPSSYQNVGTRNCFLCSMVDMPVHILNGSVALMRRGLRQKSVAKARDELEVFWLALVKNCLHSTKFNPAYIHARGTLPCTLYKGEAAHDAALNEKSHWTASFFNSKKDWS